GEVVGQQIERFDAPLSFRLDGFEQLAELLLSSYLGPGLAEKIEQPVGGAMLGRVVEEPLQGQMSGGPAGLVDRRRFGDTVDRPELEELGTGLEVPGPAGGEGLKSDDGWLCLIRHTAIIGIDPDRFWIREKRF